MNDDMNWLPWTARAYKWVEDRKDVFIIVGFALLMGAGTLAKYWNLFR